MKKIGFIGMGNMAQALATGFIKSGKSQPSDIFAYAPNQEKLKSNAQKIGFVPLGSLESLAQQSDTLFVACKPYQIEGVLEQLGNRIEGKALVSVAAGWDFGKFKKYLPESVRVQCIMPNTPVSVGAGTVLVEETNSLNAEERQELFELLESVGGAIEMPSRLMDTASSVSGCGPAFLDMVIEGLADGAVKNGLPREKAYELVCKTMMGTAKLKMESGKHPGQLKDEVCSPGGTTIRGVTALEEMRVRYAFIKAIDAVTGQH